MAWHPLLQLVWFGSVLMRETLAKESDVLQVVQLLVGHCQAYDGRLVERLGRGRGRPGHGEEGQRCKFQFNTNYFKSCKIFEPLGFTSRIQQLSS